MLAFLLSYMIIQTFDTDLFLKAYVYYHVLVDNIFKIHNRIFILLIANGAKI